MKPSVLALCCALLSAVAAARLEPAHSLSEHGRDPAIWVVDTGKAGVLLDQRAPAVAFGGDGCFALWHYGGNGGELYGVRTDEQGVVLDSAWRGVCVGPGQQHHPDISAGPDCFLAVWHDNRSGRYNVYAARIGWDGTVLDLGGFPIQPAWYDQVYPTVVAGDSCWLVAWEDLRTGRNVFGARLGFDGTVLDPAGLPIGLGPETQQYPDVAWNGSSFLVVWMSDETVNWVVRGARVAPDGTVLDPSGFDIAGDARRGQAATYPAVASDGRDFVVVRRGAGPAYELYADVVSAGGQVVGEPVSILPGRGTSQMPAIAFSQERYLVIWQYAHDVWATRLTPGGVVVDTGGIQLVGLTGDQGDVSISGAAAGWLVLWGDSDLASLHGVSVDTSGAPVGPPKLVNPLVRLYSAQLESELVRGRDSYLLAWASLPAYGANANICGVRLDDAGRLLDPAAFNVAQHPQTEYAPSIAHGDSTYLAAYGRHYRDIRVSRVTEDGWALDPYGIQIANPGDAPQVAYGGGVFLVVWYWDTREDEIRAARVEEDGYVLDPGGFTVIAGTDTKRNPCVAFDGENFLVVWETDYYVKAARVRPSGTVIDPYGFYVTSYQSRQPDVAFDGENYLVTWTDRSSYQTYGTRITPGAQHLDTARVRVSWGGYEYDCRAPRVAFNGENYVVAWEDNWSRPGIKGTLVSPDLVLLDSFDMPPPTTWGAYAPAMACGPGGGFLVFSGRAGPGMPWDTLPRIWAAHLGLPPDAVGDSVAILGVQGNFVVRPAMFRQSVQLLVPASVGTAVFRIYDAAGRCVRELGREAVAWDGKDASGRAVPAGVYLVELNGRAGDERRKVVKLE